MSFVLTLTYIAFLFLTPQVLAPSLAQYRIQLWIGLAALAASVPTLLTDRRWRAPQLIFSCALFIWIPASLILGPAHYFGGAVQAINKFFPNAIVLILVVINCRSLRRLKVVLFTLVLVAGFFVIKGAEAYYDQDPKNPFVMTEHVGPNEQIVLFRARALGVLNDPNDFAQFLLMLVPFFWLGWRRGRRARQLIIALPLTAFFAWGMFVTHSRGAAVGAAVILLFAFRRKLGNTRAAILTGCLAFIMFALNFSGGRQVSMEGGSDRLELWSEGIEAFKTSPLFGVGFGEYADAAGSGYTAHNSLVLCLTELGVAGLLFWLAPFVFTLFQLHDVLQPKTGLTQGTIQSAVTDADPLTAFDPVRRFALMAKLSLIAFLATSWFLSRAYSATCWLALGIAIATVQLAQTPGTSSTQRRFAVLVRWVAVIEFASITAVYSIVRVSHFMH